MINSHKKNPPQLTQLQSLFRQEVTIVQNKIQPIDMPFYNFVCYLVDIITQFAKSTIDGITLNTFIIDHHLRKYGTGVDCHRKMMGLVNGFKKYGQKQETKLYLSLLRNGRNSRQSVKIFIKLRKILLKNINQKILQETQLSHEDAVTIIHTLKGVSPIQKKSLIRQINEHFLNKNSKFINNAKFNAAMVCQNLLQQIIDQNTLSKTQNRQASKMSQKSADRQFITASDKTYTSSNNYFTASQDTVSFRQLSFNKDSFDNHFQSRKNKSQKNKQSQQQDFCINKNSFVNLQHCLKQLNILKQKDEQIDNRFKKISKIVTSQ